jgi:hypothetical protein
MKALLLIVAIAGVLAGCAMPARDTARMPDPGANQAMGAAGDPGLYDGYMRPWTGGDGAFFGGSNR